MFNHLSLIKPENNLNPEFKLKISKENIQKAYKEYKNSNETPNSFPSPNDPNFDMKFSNYFWSLTDDVLKPNEETEQEFVKWETKSPEQIIKDIKNLCEEVRKPKLPDKPEPPAIRYIWG
jgi:hypothetical protein